MGLISVWVSATDTPARPARAAISRATGDGRLRVFLFLIGSWLLAMPAQAGTQVYLEPEAFLAEVFAGDVPMEQKLWLTRDLRSTVEKTLDEKVAGLSLPYWQRGGETAWILESIGKERPITVGVAVNDSGIQQLRVLLYREDRGWEVRYAFFTDQFRGVQANAQGGLTKKIDGITGATLSVRALKRIARAALFLHRNVQTTPAH